MGILAEAPNLTIYLGFAIAPEVEKPEGVLGRRRCVRLFSSFGNHLKGPLRVSRPAR